MVPLWNGLGMRALAGLATTMIAAAGAARAGEPETVAEAPAATPQSEASAAGPADSLSPLATATPGSLLFWTTTVEFSGGSYRWSLSRGALDIGFRFETPSRVGSVIDSRLVSGVPVQTLPALSLGLRSVDPPAGSWLRRPAGVEPAPGYGRWVGIEWKPAESQVQFIREGLGVRLGGDDNLSMRLKRGSLALYFKRNF
jgi:hypothetical protein